VAIARDTLRFNFLQNIRQNTIVADLDPLTSIRGHCILLFLLKRSIAMIIAIHGSKQSICCCIFSKVAHFLAMCCCIVASVACFLATSSTTSPSPTTSPTNNIGPGRRSRKST
jgi:hypothetical protein